MACHLCLSSPQKIHSEKMSIVTIINLIDFFTMVSVRFLNCQSRKCSKKCHFLTILPAVSYTLSLALFGLAVDEQDYSWGACVCKLH